MSKIIVLRGLPASGKSTWAKDYISRNPKTSRVNKDDLRAMLHNSQWSQENEELVLDIRDSIIISTLNHNYDVIVDDTNFAAKHVTTIQELAGDWNAEFEVKDFDVPLDVCLERNRKRDSSVPDKVIIDMYEKYVLPKKEKVVQTPGKTKCVIVDLDGTLAIHNRDPFDIGKCGTDKPNAPVLNAIKALSQFGYRLIFLTGRENSFRPQTEKWLKEVCQVDLFAPWYMLYMRPTGDNRKDSLVKEEILRNEILPNYYVEFALDDRQQVVDHLRGMGLTVFQVAPGNY
jgi:predicted kinase